MPPDKALIKLGRHDAPCVCFDKANGIYVLMHGNDIMIVGTGGQLDHIKEELEKQVLVKIGASLGAGCKDQKEGQFLARNFEHNSDGWQTSPDSRHVSAPG